MNYDIFQWCHLFIISYTRLFIHWRSFKKLPIFPSRLNRWMNFVVVQVSYAPIVVNLFLYYFCSICMNVADFIITNWLSMRTRSMHTPNNFKYIHALWLFIRGWFTLNVFLLLFSHLVNGFVLIKPLAGFTIWYAYRLH